MEYALEYCDPTVVGALELPWPVGGQTADGGLVVLLADLWGDAMYAKSEKSTTGAASAVRVPVQAGPAVSLAGVDVAAVAKDLEDDGSDFDSTAVSSALSEPGEPPSAAGSAPTTPAEAASSESVFGEFTPGSRPPTGAGGKAGEVY